MLLLMAGQMKHQLQISTSLLYKMRTHLNCYLLKGFSDLPYITSRQLSLRVPTETKGTIMQIQSPKLPFFVVILMGENRSAIFKENILHLHLPRPK